MTGFVLISVFCPDQVGLVAAITGRLFDLGANLGDTNFVVLGGGAEFTSVCEIPATLRPEFVAGELEALTELSGAQVSVTPFALSPVLGPSGRITHRVGLRGGDQPGLIARLSEVFIQFGVNIVRLDATRVPGPGGGEYLTRLDLWIPEGKADSCLATVANTAGELTLSCHWEKV